jgi:hypothetical protein
MKTLVIAAIALAPSTALAEDSFESRAQGATKISRTDDLVWAMTASCDKGDDTQQRQCRIVRDRKAKQLAGATLLIDGDADALEIGKWSAPKKSVTVLLSACVRCGGIDVDGKPWFVMGASIGTPAPRFEGNKLRAGVLYDNSRQFPDEAAATAWTKAMATAKLQLLVKVPAETKRRFAVSGKDGLALDIVAWRVINPCDGAVVISSVPSSSIEPDKKACVATGGVVIPPEASIDALTPAMVSDAMKPVVAAARGCFEKFRMSGKAKIEITILADGTVEKFEQKGDFDGSPTAKCIDDAMGKVTFPKTKKPKTKIGFPVTLH